MKTSTNGTKFELHYHENKDSKSVQKHAFLVCIHCSILALRGTYSGLVQIAI